MLLQSLYSIITVILEVPSGYFADIYGRKMSLIIAGWAWFLWISIYTFSTSFSDFLVWEILFAVGSSFTSGTASALIFETLKSRWKELEYKKVWWSMIFYSMICMAVAWIIGWYLAQYDYRYALAASIPFFLVSFFLTFTLVEPERKRLIIQDGYLKELRSVLMTALRDKRIKWLMIYVGMLFSFNHVALWLYQPYFELSGVSVAYFGLIFACFQIVSAVTSKYAHAIEERLWQKYSLIVPIGLLVACYLCMHNFIFLFSFTFCFLQQIVRGFHQIVISDYLNQLVAAEVRATILSLSWLFQRIMYALFIPLVWVMVDAYTLEQALLFMAVICFMIWGTTLYFMNRAGVLSWPGSSSTQPS